MLRRASLLLVVLALLASGRVGWADGEAADWRTAISQADAAYDRRGSDVDSDRRAAPGPIARAIGLYERVLTERPLDLEVRWRLLRALYFAGDHSSESREERKDRLEHAREVGRIGMDQLAAELGDGTHLEDLEPDEIEASVPAGRRQQVAAIYYWTAVSWGALSQLTGTLSAIGDGVANRLYDFTKVVITLDPGYELGGAHRLRSYLHATVPSIPFISGWIETDLAVSESEKALAFDAEDRGNRVIYGVALLETRDEAREEALSILRDIAALEPREETRSEDLSIRALALEKVGEDPSSPYGARSPDVDGTGRVYMGREVSLVMGHGAAGWLERPERSDEEMPDRLVRELQLAPDAVVADIGAGTGYFSFRLADVVPEGEVLAVDIQPQMLEIIDRRMRVLGVENVRTILGSSVDPKLPEAGVDAVLLVDAYHEFSHPQEMGQKIAEALAPGGRLYLVEYRGEDDTIPIKPLHKMTVAQARTELEAAGLRWVGVRDFLPDQHLLVFEKPVTAKAR
ncbi:MAG: class I SAM-dependent methyltransferase [Candidatus Binatia bacterium]|nr:class I SAM-dependent methyltransferase [Candidatus Binatia bacterium]